MTRKDYEFSVEKLVRQSRPSRIPVQYRARQLSPNIRHSAYSSGPSPVKGKLSETFVDSVRVPHGMDPKTRRSRETATIRRSSVGAHCDFPISKLRKLTISDNQVTCTTQWACAGKLLGV
ncbi:hypothetical protein GWI33_008097 [Rhynchophorus ferrugineus]|uniref:Uncharacterized protein n=1 Tax=Rhynchophorus ferrugineus TaxID=354439 RepID=A0A834IH62_RHYFE|nr:hypothetical protein GWI33_008097 [Rhynchophorus ferrugineus]